MELILSSQMCIVTGTSNISILKEKYNIELSVKVVLNILKHIFLFSSF